MTTNQDGRKGDKLIQPQDKEQFDDNWDRIFNQPTEEKTINIEIEADNDGESATVTKTFSF